MKFTVVGVLASNHEHQGWYHQEAETIIEAISKSQDQCRDELVADGSLDLDDNRDNWEPEEEQPLDVAAVFFGHLYPAGSLPIAG